MFCVMIVMLAADTAVGSAAMHHAASAADIRVIVRPAVGDG